MKNMRVMISVVLCFLMVFNSLIIEVALYAQESAAMNTAENEAVSAADQTDEAYETLTNTKEGKTKWYMSSSTKRKIREGNAGLRDARGQVGDVKEDARGAAGAVGSIGDAISGGGNTFEIMAKVAAGVQAALIKTGQLLQTIGQLLKTVGQALQAIGQVLQAIPWTSAIGGALVKVGEVLQRVGGALDAIGKVIENIGNTARDADQTFGEMLGQVFDAGREGWRQGGEEAQRYQEMLESDAKAAGSTDSTGSAYEQTGSASDDSPVVDGFDQGEAASDF